MARFRWQIYLTGCVVLLVAACFLPWGIAYSRSQPRASDGWSGAIIVLDIVVENWIVPSACGAALASIWLAAAFKNRILLFVAVFFYLWSFFQTALIIWQYESGTAWTGRADPTVSTAAGPGVFLAALTCLLSLVVCARLIGWRSRFPVARRPLVWLCAILQIAVLGVGVPLLESARKDLDNTVSGFRGHTYGWSAYNRSLSRALGVEHDDEIVRADLDRFEEQHASAQRVIDIYLSMIAFAQGFLFLCWLGIALWSASGSEASDVMNGNIGRSVRANG